ncbi:hypothetical protein RFI_15879 [Reticulomyxa filosa]|uniref:Uncharacterized protein n=1 Tax=Reticulomyxa filosa TaxID=46433 RepID=X6N4W9_RETFI|nr:hypothetical protein RFI_15879 [Reticulomyxa filosa]|eukprot:ETO21325.1 hypothetical protein RFI_15879 [Reticulomyxa filosa]
MIFFLLLRLAQNNIKNGQMEQKDKEFKAAKIYVLLRVSINESDNDIKETLTDYGYQIQEVKRFHKIPIVKVMILSKTEDVIKVLKAMTFRLDIRWELKLDKSRYSSIFQVFEILKENLIGIFIEIIIGIIIEILLLLRILII